MTEWPTVAIGDVAKIFDGPHATPKTVTAGPIFLGIGALQDGRINLGETRHVTSEDFASWTRRVKPQPGDVVFSYETRLGQAAIIPEGFECCLGRRMGLVRTDRSKLDPRFFLYYYLSPLFQDFLRSRTVFGATVDRIALKEFPSFPIALPDLNEQRTIANVLGSLDDKIELNRRMNETLEAMAQAIFRDWFVDFGPTRRKLEGATDPLTIMGGLVQDTERAKALADLFPAAFGDDGLPEGWYFGLINDLAQQHTASVLPALFPSETFEHFSLPSYDNARYPVLQPGSEILSNKTLMPPNSVLVSKLNPEIPRVWLPVRGSTLRALSSTEFLVFTPKAEASQQYLYCMFRDERMRQRLRGMVTGTSKSHQRVSPKALVLLEVALPPNLSRTVH